jgi:glycosyltransferase involved in cell wall biosynthesis
MPKFSIVMPVWNRADIVSKSIESVRYQTFGDYELIIVDDGSQDNLGEVVESYLSEKIVYHRIPHSGVGSARNFALKQAKGDFIAYLDSDVIWHPDYLSTMWSALSESESLREAAYCRLNSFVKDPETRSLRFEGVKGEGFNFRNLVEKTYIDLNTFVHSKKCTSIVGFHDESMRVLVDMEYILRITSVFEPLFVPKVLVDYYFGLAKNALSTANALAKAHAYQYIVEKNQDEILRVIGKSGLAILFRNIALTFADVGDFHCCRTYMLKAFKTDGGNPLIFLLALWTLFGEHIFHLGKPVRVMLRGSKQPGVAFLDKRLS